VEEILQRAFDLRYRPRNALQRNIATANPKQRRRKIVQDATQARICRECAEERLSGDDLCKRLLKFALAQKQQPVLLEKLTAIRTNHGPEEFGLLQKTIAYAGDSLLRALRRYAVDDDEDEIALVGKNGVELRLALLKRQFGREKILGRTVQGEM